MIIDEIFYRFDYTKCCLADLLVHETEVNYTFCIAGFEGGKF